MAKQFFSKTGKQIRQGDEVVIDPELARPQDRGVTYVVETFAVKNVTIRPKGEPTARGTRLDPQFLIHASEAGEQQAAAEAAFVPYESPLPSGTIVRFASAALAARLKVSTSTLLVVTRSSLGRDGRPSHTLEFVGGDPDDNGRYFRGIRQSELEVIPLDRITVQ